MFIDKSDQQKILDKYKKLEEDLVKKTGKDFIEASKEYAALKVIVEKLNSCLNTTKQIEELTDTLKDPELSPELKEMFTEELSTLNKELPNLEKQLKSALLSNDQEHSKNAIIEIRAGTGGEEAALFAASLFNMYHRYCDTKKWKFEILAISNTGIGGYKEASALIKGAGAFSRLKFESGVHRVQRVPDTESSGRVHTSAATVAVLPEEECINIQIRDEDIRIDKFRASGAGGQHVNTTDSAVRITHIPSGVVVSQQDEKSQHKNKEKALKILKLRVYELEKNKAQQERSSSRKDQIGSGDRSQRIRTYNYPQGRVTDHRINLTIHNMDSVIQYGQIDDIIDALIAEDEAKKIAQNAE